jgi:hypothetical protein
MYQRSSNGGTNFTNNLLWTTEFTNNYLQTPKPKKNQSFLTRRLRSVQGAHGPFFAMSDPEISPQVQKDFAPRLQTTTKRSRGKKQLELSGGESNPGLLRVVLSNDKQKY